MKNALVDFDTLSQGDEFVFERTLFIVVVSACGHFGSAMSKFGKLVKFHAQDEVVQV